MFKNISKSIIALGIMFTLVLGLSYGTFIYTSDSYRATEMLVSNLSYGIDITASDAIVSGKTVSVSSGTTAVVYLKVTSLNKIDTKYGVDYKITKGTGTVKYASNTGWLPTGKISENNVGTYEKVVKVVITAETDMSVDFTVTGGFTNNELTEVETGYTRITEKADNVISYNDTLTNVVKKETTNNIYGGESTNNYAQYPINEDNTKNIWRILGTYNGIGTKIVSNQVSTTTKSTLSTDLTSFYNTLEKPDNYILSTDKFACTNTSCTSSSYSKVGLISTSEYEMLGGINSYLASSESYFALDNGTIKNITSGGIEETSTTSGLRPAVYLQDYVTVTGSGTVSDPFKLKMPEYAVVLNVVNGSATLPSKMITRGENATYEITPNTGYKLVLSSNTCSNGTLSGNIFTISNVTSAQTCTITLTPESYTLTLDANGGSVSTSTTTVTYDSAYGDLPTPERTGYTFNGWNGKNKFNSASTSQSLYNLTNTKGTYKQVTADTRTALQWKLQKYNANTYLGQFDSTRQDSGRVVLQFTKDDTFNNLRFGLNGETRDTLVMYDVSHLENGKTYTISANILNSTQGSISWNNVQIEEGTTVTTYEPYYISSSTKVTTARNHTLTAGWTANTYTLTFNPNGGSVSTASKIVTYDSAYGDLPTPTRTGYTFNGWYNRIYNNTFSIAAKASDNYNYTNILSSGLKPGVTYWVDIEKAEVTSGTSSTFTSVIYDFTTSTTHSLARVDSNFGSNVSFNLTMPTSADTSHDIKWLVYSGLAGSTANVATKYTNYAIYGTNKTTNTKYTSTSVVETPANQELIASWTQNTYSVTLNVTNGTGSSTKTVAYGNSATFTVSPNSGYTTTLTTNSCGGTLSGTTYTISNITSAKTCNITFKQDVPTLIAKVKSDRGIVAGRTNFKAAFSDTPAGLYTGSENGTTVYYFAGNETKNWVLFGGFYWRMVRTNADGSLRLLYAGNGSTPRDTVNGVNDGYILVGQDYNNSTHSMSDGSYANSTLKSNTENWYQQNLKTNYNNYISTTAIFCNEQSTTSQFGNEYYGSYTRNEVNHTPSYNCTGSDVFTKSNGKLSEPVGSITVDEISFAGGYRGSNNINAWYWRNEKEGTVTTSTSKYYTYSSTTNLNYWTMSRSFYNGEDDYVYILTGSGTRAGDIDSMKVDIGNTGIRPVINLKSCVKYGGGNGSPTNPYTVSTDLSGC